MSSNYIVSGIGPGKGGLGALVKSLELRKSSFNYKSLYISNPRISIFRLLKQGKLLFFLYETIIWIWSFFIIHIRMLLMRNKKIILIYPQHFHSYVLEVLIKNNEVAMYIVDNSFFCIKSYNNLSGQECTKCIEGTDNVDKSCLPLPRLWSKKSSIKKINKMKLLSKKIFFLCQNTQQLVLLQNFFDKDIKANIVGMTTGEFNIQPLNNTKSEFDIIYHGGNIEAKGVLYVLEIAKYLSDYSFLIPFEKGNLTCNLPNVSFINCKWSTGLKNYVINAKLVMCPSIWSSPVEGALLKSIAYNGNVAVYDNEFGFQNDIDSNVLLRLNSNLELSAELVDNYLRSKFTNSLHAKKWLQLYCSSLDDEKIFNWKFNDKYISDI